MALINDETVFDEVYFRRQRAFDLLGISTLLNRRNNTWVVTNNSSSLPRARLVYKVEVENDKDSIFARLFSKEFSYKDTAIVEANRVFPFSKVDRQSSGSAQIVEYLPERVRVNVQSNSDGFLILSDNFEQGWKATIDGIETKVYRTNYTFRGVIVPKGEHRVEFFYDPVRVYPV